MSEPFSWFMFLLNTTDHNKLAISHTWFVTVFLLILAFMVSGKIKRATEKLSQEDLIPEDKLTLRNAFEIYVEAILSMMDGIMKHGARKAFWLIGTIFIYIFCSNLMGLIPGLLPPTENINTNLAVSLFVFVAYNIMGIKAKGIEYFKHFLGPMLALAPLMVVIELIGECVRPVTLAIRLFGNINGDHIVLSIFEQLIPSITSPLLGLIIPIPFIGLGLFVSLMQAFVFSLLSTIYIGMATAHHDDHH